MRSSSDKFLLLRSDEAGSRHSYATDFGALSSSVFVWGSGADELFGGYARYKSRELFGGLRAWREELLKDCERLPVRNLGRDDRLYMAAGRRAGVLLPYLLHPVIEYAASLSDETLRFGGLVDDADLSTGEPAAAVAPPPEYSNVIKGDTKLVLRELALQLGLYAAAVFRKKAAQFGSASRIWE